jgi:pimeloyl-ACP methyl ester carboxylesterase
MEWQRRDSGPPDADRTVLLLPGGMCSADSFAELMAEPALAGVRLVAVTLPGHAGAPPPDDFSIESYARQAAELAHDVGADVVAGYSIGAAVAFEMAASGAFTGPIVLLGVSLSSKDEPAFFRWLVQSAAVLGSTPSRVLVAGTSPMIKRTALPDDRKREVQAMLRSNVPADATRALREYVRWLHRQDRPAERLCQAGNPAWLVHAEKGDGGLTEHERATLTACENVHLVTIPGAAFFIPNEAPTTSAQAIAEALDNTTS